jgi:ferredoxin
MYKIKLNEQEITLDNDAKYNLLSRMEAKGLPVTYGCLMGACGVCKLKVKKGMENIQVVTEPIIELESDEFLPCCSEINGDIELIK